MKTVSFFQILPYILLLFFFYYLTSCSKLKNNNALVLCLVMTLFSALRFDVGWDYEVYVPMVEKTYTQKYSFKIEWLSSLIMDLAYHLKFTQLYFIINSIITIVPIYFIAKRYSIIPALSMFIFFCDPLFFINGLSIVRNAAAISLIFLSYHFIVNKKYLHAVIILLLAGGMHNSGYIGFLLLLLDVIKLNRKHCIVIFCVSFAMTSIVQSCLSNMTSEIFVINKLLTYANAAKEVGPYLKLVIYTITISHLVFWNRLIKVDPNNRYLLSIICIGGSLWVAMSFSGTISLRFCLTFFLFNILIIPYYVYIFSRQNNRVIIKQAIMLVFSSYFLYNIYMYVNAYINGSEKMGFIPYRFFFNQDYSQFNL